MSHEFLEHQTKELIYAKKQIAEYENINLECNRKWQNLIEVILKINLIYSKFIIINRKIIKKKKQLKV